ncbi:MAG: undecaprenyl-diphosphate phosphatase [Victivallales bacterium]|nr:undecaprenyl-diphosphate phosphatase [Victivallales bacterium]
MYNNEFINALILGIIEGVTEFLPISSTGHLIIAERFFRLHEGFSEMFEVVIQLGAILSVVIYFREQLFPPLRVDTPEKKAKFMRVMDLWFKSVVGVVPALFFGALLHKYIKAYLFNPWVVAATLFVGGILLIAIEARPRRAKFDDVNRMSFRTAFFIGLIQVLAMIPGTSRSAATILGGMFLGASRRAAAEFSFFLAIPTMVAASAYSLWKYHGAMTGDDWAVLGIGFVTAFLVAWGVIALFMNYIRTRTFSAFGYYRIVLAVVVVGYFLFALHLH